MKRVWLVVSVHSCTPVVPDVFCVTFKYCGAPVSTEPGSLIRYWCRDSRTVQMWRQFLKVGRLSMTCDVCRLSGCHLVASSWSQQQVKVICVVWDRITWSLRFKLLLTCGLVSAQLMGPVVPPWHHQRSSYHKLTELYSSTLICRTDDFSLHPLSSRNESSISWQRLN